MGANNDHERFLSFTYARAVLSLEFLMSVQIGRFFSKLDKSYSHPKAHSRWKVQGIQKFVKTKILQKYSKKYQEKIAKDIVIRIAKKINQKNPTKYRSKPLQTNCQKIFPK